MRNIRKHNGDSDSNIFSQMVDAFRSLKNGSKANLSNKEKTASADETIESSDVHNNTEEVSLSDTSSDPASSDFSSDPSIYEEFSDVFDTNDDSEYDNHVNDFNSDYSSYNDYSDEFSRDHYAKTNEETVSADDDPDLSDYYSDYIVDGLSDDASDNNDVYTDNPSESSEAALSIMSHQIGPTLPITAILLINEPIPIPILILLRLSDPAPQGACAYRKWKQRNKTTES